MKLIAKKPCSFGGKQFYIGDEIPAELVVNPNVQEKRGILSIVTDGGEENPPQPIVISDPTLTICVHVNDQDMELEPTDDGIQDIFNVLIGTAQSAEAIIREMTDEDALILLHMADSRKGVKAAAEARANELNQERAGEQ